MSKKKQRETFQSLGTLAALIISVLALIVSLYETDLLRTQQEAMVWPYLRVDEKYNNEGFGLTASNNGTGPAIITSVEVIYNGKAVYNFAELADAMFPKLDVGYSVINTSSVNKTVFRNGEERSMFFIPWTDEIRKEFENLNELTIKIAYKSVLEESWLYEYPSGQRTKTDFVASKEFKN